MLRSSRKCAGSKVGVVQLVDVITQLESRLAGYREELGRTAQEITALAEDPARLGARPNMSMAPDEVLSSDPEPSAPAAETVVEPAVDLADQPVAAHEDVAPADTGGAQPGPGASASVVGGSATAVVTEAPPVEDQDAHYVDLTTQGRPPATPAPRISGALAAGHRSRPT